VGPGLGLGGNRFGARYATRSPWPGGANPGAATIAISGGVGPAGVPATSGKNKKLWERRPVGPSSTRRATCPLSAPPGLPFPRPGPPSPPRAAASPTIYTLWPDSVGLSRCSAVIRRDRPDLFEALVRVGKGSAKLLLPLRLGRGLRNWYWSWQGPGLAPSGGRQKTPRPRTPRQVARFVLGIKLLAAAPGPWPFRHTEELGDRGWTGEESVKWCAGRRGFAFAGTGGRKAERSPDLIWAGLV